MVRLQSDPRAIVTDCAAGPEGGVPFSRMSGGNVHRTHGIAKVRRMTRRGAKGSEGFPTNDKYHYTNCPT